MNPKNPYYEIVGIYPVIDLATADPIGMDVKPEPAKLYCPAHGKMDFSDAFIVERGDKHTWLCPECLVKALERIGVHQLSDKPNQVTKKW